jgi:hypothetical protein
VRRRPPLKLRLAALYRNTIFNPFWTDTRHLRRSVASLAASASGRLLDVGVGERPYGRLFEPRVSRYVGLEYPPAAENLSPDTLEIVQTVREVDQLGRANEREIERVKQENEPLSFVIGKFYVLGQGVDVLRRWHVEIRCRLADFRDRYRCGSVRCSSCSC